ncbi:MAG: hypothetical protein R2788_08840 [Saprospiraceae bacterium]
MPTGVCLDLDGNSRFYNGGSEVDIGSLSSRSFTSPPSLPYRPPRTTTASI